MREVEHEIVVDAPAEAVYGLLAAVGDWPRLFPPTVHVSYLERTEKAERLRIWASANDKVKTWTSRRELDPAALRIDFRQEVSAPPVGEMGGTWRVERVSDGRSRVVLSHRYRADGDDRDDLAWIDRAVDGNSRSELAALKAGAERATKGDDGDGFLSFEDSVFVAGPAEETGERVYAFLDRADLWEERLPHVTRVVLTEDDPGLQILEMDTRAKGGSTHTTRSVRVCFPHREIVYKQTTLPALLTLHTGVWRTMPSRVDGVDGVTVTSHHTVSIAEENVTAVLGADAGVADALAFVRDALGTNSLATLRHAKRHAEDNG
ncbi:SRPBCC family protein [Actinomadura meridiana]|uniref:SRPBCC family protein n=1 Tax=Actinomadura meridiana TaxID=559626 RepID=A0ABP8BS74_9ACTN